MMYDHEKSDLRIVSCEDPDEPRPGQPAAELVSQGRGHEGNVRQQSDEAGTLVNHG